MRRFLISVALLCTLLPGEAMSYGYAEAEDPAVTLFNSALLAARNNDWGEVEKLTDSGVKSYKGHIFDADKLEPMFKESVKTKNLNMMAETCAHLVYLSIRNKLHGNLKNNFSNYKNAKARLFMARKSYIDVLDGNIKKQKPERSVAVLKEFDIALGALGSPGLFGVGKKAANAEQYKEAVNAIEADIEKAFPSFN